MLVSDGFPHQLGDIDDQIGPAWRGLLGVRTLPVHTQTTSFSRTPSVYPAAVGRAPRPKANLTCQQGRTRPACHRRGSPQETRPRDVRIAGGDALEDEQHHGRSQCRSGLPPVVCAGHHRCGCCVGVSDACIRGSRQLDMGRLGSSNLRLFLAIRLAARRGSNHQDREGYSRFSPKVQANNG